MDDRQDRKQCPWCGWDNRSEAQFCSGCGRALQENGTQSSPDEWRNRTVSPERFAADAPVGADFIGEIPTESIARAVGRHGDYYLPQFEQMSHDKRRSRFHFFAMLFGGGWMVYRKQYRRGAVWIAAWLVYQAASLILGYLYTLPMADRIYAAAGITMGQGMLTEEQSIAMTKAMAAVPPGELLLSFAPVFLLLIWLGCVFFVGFRANRWYYDHVMKIASEVLSGGGTQEQKNEELERRGGVNMGLAVCLLVCWVIFNQNGGRILAAILK